MVKVQEYADGAVVSATDLRRNMGTVLGEVLTHYGTVQIEKKGEIVATLTQPQDGAGPTTRTFGEQEQE